MSEFEVPIVKITEVRDHPNADKLSLIYFRGFAVVSAKLDDGSHRYQEGDLVVYCPQDSIIPEYLLRQGFWLDDPVSEIPVTNQGADAGSNTPTPSLTPTTVTSTGKGMLAGPKGDRVKPIKLRGILSEGIMFPTHNDGVGEVLHDCCINNVEGEIGYFMEGDNVAEFLGITKHIPEIPIGMSGEVLYIGTHLIPHFDVENIKKYPDVLDPEEEVIVTEKLHGTFCGIGFVPGFNFPDIWDGEFFCYSKGLSARGLVFKKSEENVGNLYVRVLHTILPELKILLDAFKPTEPKFFLGEIYGKGVQDLDYGLKSPSFRIFEMYDENGAAPWDTIEMFAKAVKIDTVPVLFRGKFKDYSEQLKTGNSTLAKHVREGAVIKPTKPRRDPKIGQIILKDINEKYLTRKGGTEYN